LAMTTTTISLLLLLKLLLLESAQGHSSYPFLSTKLPSIQMVLNLKTVNLPPSLLLLQFPRPRCPLLLAPMLLPLESIQERSSCPLPLRSSRLLRTTLAPQRMKNPQL